ncbi:DUF484 family protein [Alkalilacustris brevis]|uniref:DUF484 family protein n=1 Tax=Alkalilacustris brevis TaxID=2026338 RepID=UPI000E0DCA84|nr:DUF484 family protein [Alkalilacustris brevis]
MARAGSAGQAVMDDDLRARILADPGAILDDREVMAALMGANERSMGGNIVDLRGMAMERLEGRLDRLEETHRAVIAAAYENLAGTNQVHRAVLALLDPPGFEDFLKVLAGDVRDILRVDTVRLVLESRQPGGEPALERLGGVLHVAAPGEVAAYMSNGRAPSRRQVILRHDVPAGTAIHGARADAIRSEAIMRLDLGAGRLPGMLVMGSEDAAQFRPGQGTDLLGFFAGAFERAMRRWLS